MKTDPQKLPFRPADLAIALQVTPEEMRVLAASSPFAGMFTPDATKAYVEFDVCHSAPVVAGPESVSGKLTTFHPAVLARSHKSLVHQQTNLMHLLKAHNPEKVQRDRIVGAVVATYFPDAPQGGWKIPEKKEDAVPIHVCAVMFKQAEGAAQLLEMIGEEQAAQAPAGDRWSVSIEAGVDSFEDVGIYIPGERRIVPILEADEELLKALPRDKNNRLTTGKYRGEAVALAFGAIDGKARFEGVGYTPAPAEKEAVITSARLSRGDFAGDVIALRASRIDALARQFGRDEAARRVAAAWPGATVEEIVTAGTACLRGSLLVMAASAEDPVLRVRLADGRPLLKRWSQVP